MDNRLVNFRNNLHLIFILFNIAFAAQVCVADHPSDFDKRIKPILTEHCFGCHGDGAEEGGVSLDDLFKLQANAKDDELAKATWHRVLKQVRAELMPPLDESQPTAEEFSKLESWIIRDGLKLNPAKPNPGRLTIRRLNRVEYQNTIQDLLGYRIEVADRFPPDDTGHGFDNISDVLSISPLLLEKYFDAAEEIISLVVPTVSRRMNESRIDGAKFLIGDATDEGQTGNLYLSYYDEATATAQFEIPTDGSYTLKLKLAAEENYVENVFDLNKCELRFAVDGKELLKEEFARTGGKNYTFDFDRKFKPGLHTLQIKIKPISKAPQVRQLKMVLKSVNLIGPTDEKYFVKPKNYDRFFPREVPADNAAKREYAKELLGAFASKVFRRPADEATVIRLADLAESIYQDQGETFEAGIAKSMTAILASPRFVFREEYKTSDDNSEFPMIDEYSLASRLSYFLWSSMPDQTLIDLAKAGKLRQNLDAQVARMMSDKKFDNFVENFTGQWLQARSIESVPIDARSIARRDAKPDPAADKKRERVMALFRKSERTEEENKELDIAREEFRKNRKRRIELSGRVRRAMQQETELSFSYIVRDDRSLLELLDSNYTFLNEELAKFYQIDGVEGREMRKFDLADESVRGGVLTQGTVLAVTSNPDRTSPVKRGLFVLENLLGTPTSAPPPNIPALEDIEQSDEEKLSLRKTLELHRKDPNCSSCHNRLDPLGLALENFNAMGRFRTEELGQPIDSKGMLITGETFSSVKELKKILATSRKTDFYRCLTEKMLTYAVGRAVEYHDIPFVDKIVDDLETNKGRSSYLIYGIIHSDAFQRMGN